MVIAITAADGEAEMPTPTTPVSTEPTTEAAIKNFAAMTREQLERHTMDVREQLGDLTLVPPTINTKPLPEFDYPNLDYAMTLGIERTPGGRLWAAWVAGDDGPAAFMVAATSDDGGDTWSKPRFVINSQIPNFPVHRSVIVGNFWTDPLGRLWFFFDQTINHYDGRQGLWASLCTKACLVDTGPAVARSPVEQADRDVERRVVVAAGVSGSQASAADGGRARLA